MTAPQPTLPAIALAELERRVAQANEAIRTRQRTRAQLDPQLRCWAAIAAFLGADVRPLLTPHPGVAGEDRPLWVDFFPRVKSPDALRLIAQECRRAFDVAAARHTAAPDDTALRDRLHALQRLDTHFVERSAIAPWQPAPRQKAAA